MKKRLLIVGAGGFGRVVLEFASKTYDCYFVDDGRKKGEIICGTEVIGETDDLALLFNKSNFSLLTVAIGNNAIRERISSIAQSIGYDIPNIIGDNVYISPYAVVGCGLIALNNVSIQNGAHVGNGVILNPGVEIHHDSTVCDYSIIYTNSVVRTSATVKERVKIGSNSTICNNATVKNDQEVPDCTAIR